MNTMRDALHNCSLEVTHNKNSNRLYAKGVVVGAVASYMQTRQSSFETAVKFVARFMPQGHKLDWKTVPYSWLDEFRKHL